MNIEELYKELCNKKDFLYEVWEFDDKLDDYRAKRMGYYYILKEREKN